MEITKLKIDCLRHGKRLAVTVYGGEIWCKGCQEEFIKSKEPEPAPCVCGHPKVRHFPVGFGTLHCDVTECHCIKYIPQSEMD